MTQKWTIRLFRPMTRHVPVRLARIALWSLTIATLLAFAFGSDAAAQGVSAYFGGGLGVASTKFDKDHIEFHTNDLSPSKASWRVFGGCQFHPNLGMEVGYVSLDEARITEQVYQDFFGVKITGVDVSGLLILPVVPAVSVYRRGGVVFWSSDQTYRFTDIGSGTSDHTGNDLVLGLGARLDLSRSLGLRGEYTRYQIDKTEAGAGNIDMISANALISFGGKAQ